MSNKNDKIKEKLAYLRQWLFSSLLGVFGIAGWIFTYNKVDIRLFIAIIGLFIFVIHAIIFNQKFREELEKWK